MGREGGEKLISDDEMAQLEALLPSRSFQQFKVLFNGLLEKLRTKDYEGISRFRDQVADQIGKIEQVSDAHAKTVQQFGRGREAGFSRVRMQSMFLDRVARMAKSKASPDENIVGFPIGKMAKAQAPIRYKPAAKPGVPEPAERRTPALRPPALRPPPSLPLVRGGTVPTPAVEPVSSALPELRQEKVMPKIGAKTGPKAGAGVVGGVPSKEKPVKEKAKPVLAQSPLKKEAVEAPPQAKKKSEKDLKKYYEDRRKQVMKEIEKDQRKGARIRFKEGESFDPEEPDAQI